MQSVQLLVSNSNATATLESGPRKGLFHKGVAPIEAISVAAFLILCLRRRKLPLLVVLGALTFIASVGLIGCAQGPTSLEQVPGTYPFTVTVNSGSTTLQTLSFTLTVPSN